LLDLINIELRCT